MPPKNAPLFLLFGAEGTRLRPPDAGWVARKVGEIGAVGEVGAEGARLLPTDAGWVVGEVGAEGPCTPLLGTDPSGEEEGG